MANICKNTITVVGVEGEPESFVKALSKVMFGIDLDDMNPNNWDENEHTDENTWYSKLTDEYRREGPYAARYYVLYPKDPYDKLGVTAPRFYVETKWEPPLEDIDKASKVFPELTFHVDWWLMQDGPNGEYVIRDGEVVERIKRDASLYLFDWSILYPMVNLLPAHLPYTLAQQGALRVEDAIQTIEGIRGIFENKSVAASPCDAYRDRAKVEETRKTLDALLVQMKEAAKRLTFEGVFINDPRCRTFYDHEKQPPTGPTGDYQRRADEALRAEAAQEEKGEENNGRL